MLIVIVDDSNTADRNFSSTNEHTSRYCNKFDNDHVGNAKVKEKQVRINNITYYLFTSSCSFVRLAMSSDTIHQKWVQDFLPRFPLRSFEIPC